MKEFLKLCKDNKKQLEIILKKQYGISNKIKTPEGEVNIEVKIISIKEDLGCSINVLFTDGSHCVLLPNEMKKYEELIIKAPPLKTKRDNINTW